MRPETSHQHWLASGLFLGSLLVLAVLMFIPQTEADTLTYLGLAAGLLMVSASLATFVGLQTRRLFQTKSLQAPLVAASVRQGLEASLVIVGGVFLWAFNGLTWWELGLLIAAVIFAEIALGLKKNPFLRT